MDSNFLEDLNEIKAIRSEGLDLLEKRKDGCYANNLIKLTEAVDRFMYNYTDGSEEALKKLLSITSSLNSASL